ncbi:hypothetical protein A3844_01785 [Paenibacillus helianthi]|uniref:Uncharacterized protein n=1 Tax=Paenibacillus helianthi TaxID=1349432 RepID=A0ABX3EUP2_9BACL|nr:hypothetical protein [Paenibacillus helianthi]OKP91869.1 hypothetical protein A3844_01785 [Paenibacillus helianthi]
MLLLVSGATPTVRKYAASPNLGCLLTPRSRNSLESMAGLPWAADNDCFGGFDSAAESRFRAMLTKIAGTSPLFVTAPDVVADAACTLAMFDTWEPIIREHGLPVALVLQDGQEKLCMPWGRCEAVFIGGSTDYKLSDTVRWLVREAKWRGKWVHMGRVNSLERLRIARDMGCDSVDGTGYSRFPDANLPGALKYLQHEQLVMNFYEPI